jgi:16S rRNA G966 N2-methylase RsmD
LIELYYRLFDYYYEWRLNVDTSMALTRDDLGFQNLEYRSYEVIKYRLLFSILNRSSLDKTHSTFLDYGCGKGRAIIAAATFHFRKIIGVEISDLLIPLVKANINKMRQKKTNVIQIIQTNAADYIVPSDVNIIYLFNPFVGETLRQVMNTIYSSYKQFPRKIHIIFFNNKHFDSIIDYQGWLTKTVQKKFDPYNTYAIYETKIGDE